VNQKKCEHMKLHEYSIQLAKPSFDEEMLSAAVEALQNERYVMGESVFRFEEEFARYCGTEYAVSTNSGTAALQLSLIAVNAEKGQRVVTTPASYVATANAVLHVGAIPVFADINIKNYTVDPTEVTKRTTKETKVILPVHLYGYPADMDSIKEIARRKGIKVVEDACQAHGAQYKGQKAGAIGDVGCFSFFPSKNMTVCGDGGMVTTNDEEVARTVAKLRDCGRRSKYVHDMVGYNARLNTVNAAIGRVQLKRLDGWNEKRRKNAGLYDKLLSDLDEVTLPPKKHSNVIPVYHFYVIRAENRDMLEAWLEKSGIQCGIHYPIPIHLQPIYQELFGFREGQYPKSELLSKTCLSLPIFPDLSVEQLKFICEKIHEFYDLQMYKTEHPSKKE